MRKILLASASPRRRELLEEIGVSFEICPSSGEEKITKEDPAEVVKELSAEKARDIFQKTTGDMLVIGADTVVALDGEILGKPRSAEDAVRMLDMLQNREHQVFTGVTVLVREGEQVKEKTFHEVTRVTFYPMSQEEIAGYVRDGEPMDKAGAYGIQGKGALFVKEIHGDYKNVVGLPTARLYQELKDIGIKIKEW